MAEDGTVFVISNEDDAINLLRDALENKIDPGEKPAFRFKDWPHINIELPATPIEGSISPPMMEGFLELQRSIYRTHAILSNGDDSLRGVNQLEKERFEIRVQVEKGSSLYSINLQQIIERLGHDVVAKMSGTELVIATLCISLIVGGVISWKAWLDHRTDQRRIDSSDDDAKIMLDSFKTHLDHDTKRYEMLTRAISQQPELKRIEAANEPARQEIVSALADEKGGSINGIELDKTVALEVSTKPRDQSVKVEMSRIFRVAKVDTTVPDGFRVTLTDNKGKEISASLLDALVSSRHRAALQQAEWAKKPIKVTLRGRRLRGDIVGAEILSVEEI